MGLRIQRKVGIGKRRDIQWLAKEKSTGESKKQKQERLMKVL